MPKIRKYFESPIFSIVCTEKFFILSGGGGSKKFGLKNSLSVFGRPSVGFILKDTVFKLDIGEEIIERLRQNFTRKMLIGNSNNFCIIYKLEDNGEIIEITRFQTDWAVKEACQNDAFMNKDGEIIVTGGEDGVVRIWKFNGFEVEKQCEFSEQAKVQTIDIHQTDPLTMITYDNSTIKFINYQKEEVIALLKLTNNPQKLRFFSSYFVPNTTQFFTIANPTRGSSFLTFWDIRPDNTINQLQSYKANQFPVSACCLSRDGNFIGIGGSDGEASVFNIRTGEFECNKILHEMPIKGIDFTWSGNYLLTGSADFTYEFMQIQKQSGWVSNITLVWFIIVLLLFFGDLIFQFIQ